MVFQKGHFHFSKSASKFLFEVVAMLQPQKMYWLGKMSCEMQSNLSAFFAGRREEKGTHTHIFYIRFVLSDQSF